MSCSDSNYSNCDISTSTDHTSETPTCTDSSTCTDVCADKTESIDTCTDTSDKTSNDTCADVCNDICTLSTNSTHCSLSENCTSEDSTCTDTNSCLEEGKWSVVDSHLESSNCTDSTTDCTTDNTCTVKTDTCATDCTNSTDKSCNALSDVSNTSKTSSSYTNTCDTEEVFVYHNQCIQSTIKHAPLVLGATKLKNVQGADEMKGKVALAVHGDIYVSGQIYTGNYKSTHIHSDNKINLNEKHYIESTPTATYYYVNPKEHSNILYVSAINGPVYVVLGSKKGDVSFKENQEITIKDTSLCYNQGSSYNIFITVPNGNTGIEHYGVDCKLKVSNAGTYILNTSNGAVTFRYMHATRPCWLIETQFIGNTRVLPGTGLKFNQVNPQNIKYLMK